MKGTGSSSKRKFLRKKSSKISSEARRRKRNRRNKSKKLRCHDGSASSYSEDSSSSCEEDYKSRRARSRVRIGVKSSRKRGRRNPSSKDSSEDSPRVRKRKGSKRNGDSDMRKKTQKKKPRRDASISSTSSDSRSCSTCRGGSSDESEFERLRGSSRENKKYKRDSGKAKSATKKRKNRSRSCSPCGRCSYSSGNHGTETLEGENNSRRLRSVITVTKPPLEREENERDEDEHKEEIVYDHDDYPSSRSNDSNDGGSKRELAHHTHVSSEKRRVENVMEEEPLVSNLSTAKPTGSGEDAGGQCNELNPCANGIGTSSPKKENESVVSATVAGSNDDTLESILRQKALENLKRFRGGLQTKTKIPADEKIKSDSHVKQLSAAKAEFVRNKSPKQDGSSVAIATQLLDQSSKPTLRRDFSRPTQAEGLIPDGKYSGTVKQSIFCLPDGAAISGNVKEKDHTSARGVNKKSESSRLTLRQESLGTDSILMQTPASQASPKATLLLTKSGVDKIAAETSHTAVESSSNNQGIEVTDTSGSAVPEPSSCINPASEEPSSRVRQAETKDGSEFKQKTMSVMRGGEMVQVSYKVYIPKKAPALARRQLQR